MHNMPKEDIAQNYQSLHNQLVASSRAVKRAHSIDPQYQVGCMMAGACSYPLTCDSADESIDKEGLGNFSFGSKKLYIQYYEW